MEDISTRISRLKRPKLLVRTARHALEDYDRCMHLRRLLKTERLPSPGRALMQLLELEGVMNDQRIAGRAEYSVARPRRGSGGDHVGEPGPSRPGILAPPGIGSRALKVLSATNTENNDRRSPLILGANMDRCESCRARKCPALQATKSYPA